MSEERFDAGNIDELMQRLEDLRAQHHNLNIQIEALELQGNQAFQIMGLKREKLRVKDHITWLSAKLTPDIIA